MSRYDFMLNLLDCCEKMYKILWGEKDKKTSFKNREVNIMKSKKWLIFIFDIDWSSMIWIIDVLSIVCIEKGFTHINWLTVI